MRNDLALAFPSALNGVVASLVTSLPVAQFEHDGVVTSSHSHNCPDLILQGEEIRIPYRIYNPEPPRGMIDELVGDQRALVACLYSRHNDGFVRQRWLRALLTSHQPWVAPFVIQLLGEYVVEIAAEIEAFAHEQLPARTEQRHAFSTFLAVNPCFARLTEQRAISYWSAYYRRRYPSRTAYPALRALRTLGDPAPTLAP
ncbi:MAG: hypothetical protein ABIP19_01535 [Dermatophilaceae bacterium]